MNMNKIQIQGPSLGKSSVCEPIMRSLPKWFGKEESIIEYLEVIDVMPTILADSRNEVVGFLAVNVHNTCSAEMHVMAIRPEYHRRGIGRKLVQEAGEYLL